MKPLGIFFLDHRSHYINSLGDALGQMGHRLYVHTSWNMREVEAAIDHFRPEVLFTVGCDLPMYNPDLDIIPDLCEKYGLFHIYWATEDKIHFASWSLPFVRRMRPHLVWTVHPHCVEAYESCGFPAEYVNFAFNPRWFPEKSKWGDEIYDISLIASTHLHVRTFRYDSLAQLLVPLVREKVKIHIWGFGWEKDRQRLQEEFGIDIPLDWLKGYLPYLQTADVYRRSKIVLALQNARDQVTQRTFEILGTGTLMMANATEALNELFEDGKEVVLTHGPDETLELIRYYLSRPRERETIGRAARKKVMSEHTYTHRLRRLDLRKRILAYREEKTPMIPLVDVKRQFRHVKKELMAAFEGVLDEGTYILGEKVKELEEKAAAKLGVRHAVGVANGTDALVLSLDALGIGPGDEVITTPFTFFATAEAISRVGATPVFVDIDPDTYNLDPRRIEEKITPATKAILPVHLFGRPAEMDPILDLARKYRLHVIEDACQAFGAAYRGRPAGSLGNAACFSFFPTKNLGTMGDGGLVTTNDGKLAERIRMLRQHGSVKKYYHREIGYNSRLDELHAALLLVFLHHIDDWNQRRRELAARYREGLKRLDFIRILPEQEDIAPIYHLFCVETPQREPLARYLEDRGIQTGVYYPLPLHLQEAYRSLGYGEGAFPAAEKLSRTVLALPMGPFLSDGELDEVVSAIRSYGRKSV